MRRNIAQIIVRVRDVSYISGITTDCDRLKALLMATTAYVYYMKRKCCVLHFFITMS